MEPCENKRCRVFHADGTMDKVDCHQLLPYACFEPKATCGNGKFQYCLQSDRVVGVSLWTASNTHTKYHTHSSKQLSALVFAKSPWRPNCVTTWRPPLVRTYPLLSDKDWVGPSSFLYPRGAVQMFACLQIVRHLENVRSFGLSLTCSDSGCFVTVQLLVSDIHAILDTHEWILVGMTPLSEVMWLMLCFCFFYHRVRI